ncbi:MAG: T9SS type A sorting domain-containing protein [Saprospiraceae bacterium]
MKNLFLFLVFILPISINAQAWDKVYPADSTIFGLGFSIGFEVNLTSEGGYLLGGEVDLPTGAIRHYLRLVKTDQLGDVIWQHTYTEGDIINEEVHFVKELTNQDIMVGSSQFGFPHFRKIDAMGNSIWEKTYESDTSHVVQSGIVCPDGNYLMAGSSGFGSDTELFLLKFDLDANLIWKKYYVLNSIGNLLAINSTSDGGFIAIGSLDSKVTLFKFSLDGNLDWTKSYDFSTFDNGFTINQTLDGGYIAGGITTGINSSLPLVFKTDSLGNGEWTKTLIGNPKHQVSNIILKPDGNYIVVGALQGFWGFSQNGFIIELDEFGEEVWSEDFTSLNQQIASIKHTSDGGYILAGAAPEGMLLKKIGGTTSTKNNDLSKFDIKVFPNPMTSQTIFKIKKIDQRNINLQIFDVMGKMVREETHTDSTFIFYKKNLSSGIYFYKVNSKNMLLGNGKIVIN